MNKIISDILDSKKKKIKILQGNKEGLLSLIKKAPKPRSFKKAISREGKISFIAELKQASPSKGVIRQDFSIIDLAKIFSKEKVNAISVLTEEDFFLGKINYIEEVRKIVNVPILRKDFIIDQSQILEARAAGADAVLLIARILDKDKLLELYNAAKDLGMDALVEVHTEKELRRVISLNVDIIGINNRNLSTFSVELNTTGKLAPFVPKGITLVSESGVFETKDMLLLKGMGVHAVLVGGALMETKDVSSKIRELHIDV